MANRETLDGTEATPEIALGMLVRTGHAHQVLVLPHAAVVAADVDDAAAAGR